MSPNKPEGERGESTEKHHRNPSSSKGTYSPTKYQRNDKKRKTETTELSPTKVYNYESQSGNQSYLGSDKQSPKNAVAVAHEEKRKRAFQIKKNILLKEFEVAEPDKKKFVIKSPTTESMKDSLAAITYRRPGDKEAISQAQTTHENNFSPKKKGTTNFIDFAKLQVPVDGKVVGHKPCARDGHSALWCNGRMLIFGGDRHKMSFNDIHIMSLEPIITSRKDI